MAPFTQLIAIYSIRLTQAGAAGQEGLVEVFVVDGDGLNERRRHGGGGDAAAAGDAQIMAWDSVLESANYSSL